MTTFTFFIGRGCGAGSRSHGSTFHGGSIGELDDLPAAGSAGVAGGQQGVQGGPPMASGR